MMIDWLILRMYSMLLFSLVASLKADHVLGRVICITYTLNTFTHASSSPDLIVLFSWISVVDIDSLLAPCWPQGL